MKTFALKTNGPARALFVVALVIGLGSSTLRVQAQNSPEGTWDLVVSGSQRGVAQITFLPDFTLVGWELITGKKASSSSSDDNPRGGGDNDTRDGSDGSSTGSTNTFFNGIAELSGMWTYDESLRVIGVMSESGGTNSVTNGISFRAVIKPRSTTTNFTMKAVREGRTFTFSGAPLKPLADLSGNYYGVGKKDGKPFNELFTLTPGAGVNVYDAVGFGPNTSYVGAVAVSAKNQMAFVSYFGTTNALIRSVAGAFQVNKGTGKLKGFMETDDVEDPSTVTLKVTKQP